MQPPVSDLPDGQVLFEGAAFAEWSSLNDTIMGGRSRAGCRVDADGLVLEGELIEQGGGFVSCRSPRLQPPLDLSPYSALQLDVQAEGRTLKIALGCRDGALGLTELIPGGLRWVVDVPPRCAPQPRRHTVDRGSLFRSSPDGAPNRWACRCVSIVPGSPRIQVLHSKASVGMMAR